MRDLLEKLGTGALTDEELISLEDNDLILYYDGYHITYLGWLLLLRGRAPTEQIVKLLEIDEAKYQELVAQLKEKSL